MALKFSHRNRTNKLTVDVHNDKIMVTHTRRHRDDTVPVDLNDGKADPKAIIDAMAWSGVPVPFQLRATAWLRAQNLI